MADCSPEVIAAQMAVTRTSLSEKLATLEDKVVHSVEQANTFVQETIESARDVVHDTAATFRSAVACTGDTVKASVGSVKEVLDVPHQVRQHPWAAVGSATLAGFVLGRMTEQGRHAEVRYANFEADRVAADPSNSGTRQSVSNIPAVIARHLEPLKAFAIGAAMLSVRNMLGNALHDQWRKPLFEAIDDITRELGGRPLEEQKSDSAAK